MNKNMKTACGILKLLLPLATVALAVIVERVEERSWLGPNLKVTFRHLPGESEEKYSGGRFELPVAGIDLYTFIMRMQVHDCRKGCKFIVQH